jgi:hypothetical protein
MLAVVYRPRPGGTGVGRHPAGLRVERAAPSGTYDGPAARPVDQELRGVWSMSRPGQAR